MPQPSYPYACARISALEKTLLDAAAVRRMADGSFEDAMRTLQDIRYGGVTDAAAADVEALIDYERNKTAKEITELSPAPELTNLLLLGTDVHNLKTLIKARLLESADVDFLAGGLYEREYLSQCVAEGNYAELPKELSEALNDLENRLRVRVEPQMISVWLDRGYYAYALRVAKAAREPFILDYFTASCDFNNLLTFLRMRAMGAQREDMRRMLLPEGDISYAELLGAYELSYETLFNLLTGNRAREAIVRGLNEMLKSGNIGALERERDDYLLSLVKSHRHDVMTIFPIVGYYLARDRESRAIRLILTVKKNGLDDAVIQERLRELYG